MNNYAKLSDDNWGIRGRDLEPGALVEVRRADGKDFAERVGEILETFPDGTQIARIDFSFRSRKRKKGKRRK